MLANELSGFQLAQQFLVFRGEPRGHFDLDAHQQVALRAVARVGHAATAQGEHVSALGAARDGQLIWLAFECGHLDAAAEGGRGAIPSSRKPTLTNRNTRT